MKTGIGVILAAIALGGRAWAGLDSTNQSPQQIRLELDLADGSHVIGAPNIESVPLQTTYAKMDIALKQILTVKMGEDHETASIALRNGDKLKGVISLAPIKLATVFGDVAIGIEHVKEIGVLLSGGGLPESLKKGLVLYYSFEGDEGGKVTDGSSKGNDGEVKGAKWTPSGKIGGAYDFAWNAQGDNRIVTPDSKTLDPVSGITLSVWFKVAKWKECARLIEKAGESNARGMYFLAINSSVNRLIDFGLELSGEHAEHLSTCKVETDTWYHTVGTYDSRTGDMCLYVNGLPDSQWKHTGTIQANAKDLYIGHNPFGFEQHFDGLRGVDLRNDRRTKYCMILSRTAPTHEC